jgi:hypothetical protein
MPASTDNWNRRSCIPSRSFTCVICHFLHLFSALASHLSLFISVRQQQLLSILRSTCLSTAAYLDAALKPASSSSAPPDMRALRQVVISGCLTCYPPIFHVFAVQMLLNAITSPHSAASIPLPNEAPSAPSSHPAPFSSFTTAPSNTPHVPAQSAAAPSEFQQEFPDKAAPLQHSDPNQTTLGPCDAPDQREPLSPRQLKAVAGLIADAFFEKRIAFQQLFVLADSAQEVPTPFCLICCIYVSLSLIIRA